MHACRSTLEDPTGEATGDRELEREGKFDQAGAAAKEKANQAKDKFDDLVDKTKDKLSERQ